MHKQHKQVLLSASREAGIQDIPFIKNGDNILVDARLLHQKLGSKRQFANWIKDQIADYGFEENTDFLTNLLNQKAVGRGGDRKSREYYLTIDTAKEIAMVSKTEAGRQIRRYFIAKEQELRGISNLPKEANLFKGLKAKRFNNRVMYPYREVLVRCGYSPNANGNRKARYWMHFVKDGAINYVSAEFAQHIHHSRQVYTNRKTMLASTPILPLHFYNTNQLNLFE